MKTLTTTKATTAKASLRISEFSVSERWVQITATIREEHFPKFNAGAIPELAMNCLVSSYSNSLSIYAEAARLHGRKPVGLYDISLDAGKWGFNRLGTLHLTRSKEVTFRMRERQWRRFMANCEFIGYPPEAVIRGAFGARATELGMPGHRARN